MKVGLLEKIQSHGHWRINIRPLVSSGELLSFQTCLETVQKSSVSIRGWDYPHISHRNDDEGGSSRADGYVENWTDWYGFFEFWRMYRSSQFLSYCSLRSDTGAMGTELTAEPVLSIVDAIYSVTEFLEFCHRMHINGLYEDGLLLSVMLVSNGRRQLSVGSDRMPFFDAKVSESQKITIERSLSKDAVRENYQDIAVKILLELFDHFGWNPEAAQIRNDQERFYKREWSY